jgi:hypothetical protein
MPRNVTLTGEQLRTLQNALDMYTDELLEDPFGVHSTYGNDSPLDDDELRWGDAQRAVLLQLAALLGTVDDDPES